MSEVKYRGKVDGVWWHVSPDDNPNLFGQFWHIVDRETVGQFTGMTNKHGKEIWEGDILQLGHAREKFAPLASPDTRLEVFYTHGAFSTEEGTLGDVTDWHECEIIGNRYETPELLQKAGEQ